MPHYEGPLVHPEARWRITGVELDPPGDLVARIWKKDSSVWPSGEDDPAERLGWLDLPATMPAELAAIEAFVRDVAADMDTVGLLGMGGSSLAPEVFAFTFGSQPGHPKLAILDSTHPRQIRDVEAGLDLARTLWLVSSKSGGTVETMSLYKYFRSKYEDGVNFAAITDPGTSLHRLAESDGFANVFLNPPDIGGRYSALSLFGLVPAAALGVDTDELLTRAGEMAELCRSDEVDVNPALAIGWAIGSLAQQGRDKLTFLLSPALRPFGDWVEQLIAESTGKTGMGVTPVVGEPVGEPAAYGDDRTFVEVRLRGDEGIADVVEALRERGHPVISLPVAAASEVGAHMYLWELATAVAGAALRVNPFDQPDVEAAKRATRGALTADASLEWSEDDPQQLFEGISTGEVATFLAFAPRTSEVARVLAKARDETMSDGAVATSAGIGPRYLHSTGQLHKGGPAAIRALVVLDAPDPDDDLPVPGEDYSFGRLLRAQAAGDYQTLESAGRSVARTTWSRFAQWAEQT